MNKLLKKILLSTFMFGALFFISSNISATNYRVNIAVVGSKQHGKTQLLRCIFGQPFQPAYDPTSKWSTGAMGKRKTYQIEGDTFDCKFYDAPGYLKDPVASLDQQIDSMAVREANIVLIVVNPKPLDKGSSVYTDSVDEALVKHAHHVRGVNSECAIIVVVSQIDRLSDSERGEYRDILNAARMLHRRLEIDGVLTSSQSGEGITDLENKIQHLLTLRKAKFTLGCFEFVDCVCGHEQDKDRCVHGCKGANYCCAACLEKAEAKMCSRGPCTNKGRFLARPLSDSKLPGGFESPQTGKMYCSRDCYILAEEGEPCARGATCPDCSKKFFRDRGEGFISPFLSHKLYCSKECCIAGPEGQYCHYSNCYNRFLVTPDGEGKEYFTDDRDNDKVDSDKRRYCPGHAGKAHHICAIM